MCVRVKERENERERERERMRERERERMREREKSHVVRERVCVSGYLRVRKRERDLKVVLLCFGVLWLC